MDIATIPTKRLEAAIDQLADADQRRLVTLRYVRGLAVKEAIRALNISRSAYYRRHREALTALDNTLARLKETEQAPLVAHLHHANTDTLVGVQRLSDDLAGTIIADSAPWLVAVDGIGGIGKTALAARVVTSDDVWFRFERVLWVSARQEHWNGNGAATHAGQPALSEDDLVVQLLEQLGINGSGSQTEQRLQLIGTLKAAPYLVAIDNLETVTDYETLLPLLRGIANPSRILLTSRHSLRDHSDIRSITVGELPFDDAVTLIKHDAARRGMPEFEQAGPKEFEAIYEVVGGNPLALKLVVGQLSVLPLSMVLENLQQAQGQDTEALYTFIYWQAWELLDDGSQQVFLVMPILHGSAADDIAAMLSLEPPQVQAALRQLAKLSLVQVGGGLNDRRYTIHRLTESFLLNEAIRWQSNEDRYGHVDLND